MYHHGLVVQIRTAVPVMYDGQALLGTQCGSFINRNCPSDGALFMLPPLEGGDEDLSSTSIREAVSVFEKALTKHGYPAESLLEILNVATSGEQTVKTMGQSGKARNEWVSSMV
jgi:hypothetical protein